MWRIVYSKFKLTPSEKEMLQAALEEFTYSCGAQIKDLKLGGRFDGEIVAFRQIHCYEPLEKLYYAVGEYETICIYCCSDMDVVCKEDFYPQCKLCTKEPVRKRK